KIVSKASDDFPDPDTPVTTTSAPRGRSTSIPFRLCSEAPRTDRTFTPALYGQRLPAATAATPRPRRPPCLSPLCYPPRLPASLLPKDLMNHRVNRSATTLLAVV